MVIQVNQHRFSSMFTVDIILSSVRFSYCKVKHQYIILSVREKKSGFCYKMFLQNMRNTPFIKKTKLNQNKRPHKTQSQTNLYASRTQELQAVYSLLPSPLCFFQWLYITYAPRTSRNFKFNYNFALTTRQKFYLNQIHNISHKVKDIHTQQAFLEGASLMLSNVPAQNRDSETRYKIDH